MLERHFKVTLSYNVTLIGPETSDNSALHVMEAVYASQVGNTKGTTTTKPELEYEAEELRMTITPRNGK